MKVPFLRANLSPPETWVPLLVTSYEHHRFSNFGPLYARFCNLCTERFATDGYRAVLVANATVGLTAALIAREVRGDVIIPAFTFPATMLAVIAAGCRPVLCDVDPQTWELDTGRVRRLLETRRIGAVMPVRSFGLFRDYTDMLRVCAEHRCPVIVDAAASFGHNEHRHAIGSPQGHVEVFSLHATKVFSIGEGGLVFAPRDVAAALERVQNFGLNPDRTFGDGCNAKVDEVRCAIGLAALESIDAVIATRSALAAKYLSLFARYPQLVQCPAAAGPTPWQTFPIRFRSGEARSAAVNRLASRGIETRPYYAPALGEGYKGRHGFDWERGTTPVAEALAQQMLCFPIYESITEEEQAFVLAETAVLLEDMAAS